MVPKVFEPLKFYCSFSCLRCCIAILHVIDFALKEGFCKINKKKRYAFNSTFLLPGHFISGNENISGPDFHRLFQILDLTSVE